MADGYIGEIRLFPYGYAPEGWFECNGQSLPQNQYQALYAVIGSTYGTPSKSTFSLPNLCGRIPVGTGQGAGLSSYTLLTSLGTTAETLSLKQTPAHSHLVTVLVGKNDPAHGGNAVFLSDPANANLNLPVSRADSTQNYAEFAGYSAIEPDTSLASATLQLSEGNSQKQTDAHTNQQPFLPLRFCICWNGIYPLPSQS
jgi:microcystin-dependent protein